MPVVEHGTSISPHLTPAVATGVDCETPVTGRSEADGWDQCIDGKLIEWGRTPAFFGDEDEIIPPAPEIVSLATKIAGAYREMKFPAPDNVVPDGDGGIVFELSIGTMKEFIHIWDDGNVEYYRTSGTELVERYQLEFV
jgi:hypothetical protein